MVRIFSFLKDWNRYLLLELILKVLGTFSELSLPFILAYVIDEIVPSGDISRAWRYGLLMVCVSVLACALHLVTNRMSAWIAAEIGHAIRSAEMQKIFGKTSLTEEMKSSEMIGRVTGDTYTVTDSIGLLQRGGMRIPLTMFGSVCIMLYLDAPLALGMLAGIALAVLGASRRVLLGSRCYVQAGRGTDRMIRTIREDYDGIPVIRSFRAEGRETERYLSVAGQAYGDTAKADLLMAAVKPVMQAWLYTVMIGMLFLGAWQIHAGKIAAGTLVAFMSYVTMLQGALTNLMRILVNMTRMKAAMERINEILGSKESRPGMAVPEDADGMEISGMGISDMEITGMGISGKENSGEAGEERNAQNYLSPGSGHVLSCRDLSFRREDTAWMMKDISFRVRTGEILCVVGGPESGKTTLLELLTGFLTPDGGEICLDGRDLGGTGVQMRRGIFSAAFQKERLFQESAADNIRFRRDALTEEDLLTAAKEAQADAFLRALPEGWNAIVDHEGRNFSGGQRQRLRLARALADRTPVLILDDSLSALDRRTLRKVMKALRSRKEQIIVLLTQQAELAEDADQVLLLEEGRMAGYGTFAGLKKDCEAFRELLSVQEEVPETA